MLTTAAAEAPGAVSQDDIRKRRLNSWPSTNSLGQRPVSEGRGRWGDPEMLSGPSHRRNPTEHQQRLGANKKCSFEGLTLSGTETSWIPSGWALSGPSHETSPWRPAAGGRSAAMERQQSMPALRQSPSLSQNNKSRRLGSIGEDGPWRESVSQSSFRGNRRLAGAASSSTLSVSYSSTPPTEASPRLIRPPGLSLRPKSASWNLRESPDASISGAGARLLKQEPIGLFLLNIPSWVRVPEILNLFTPFGSVVNVGIEAETEPVYAFVDFAADEGRDSAVSRALSELAGRTFFSMDIPLTLAPRFDRTSKPVFPVSEPEPPARESPATFDYQTLYIPALPCHVTKVLFLCS